MSSRGEGFLGTVLITGGGGFLGGHIVQAFLEDSKFDRVVATLQWDSQYQVPGAEFHVCDTTSSAQIKALFATVKPSVVIHAASPGAFGLWKTLYEGHYVATKLLVDLARQDENIKAFIFTGSVEAVVLKSGFNSKPEPEEDAIVHTFDSKTTPYARLKGATEALVLDFNTPPTSNDQKSFKGILLTTSLRLSGLYGPRDKPMCVELLKLVNTFGTRFQLGPNKALHDWLYAPSAAKCFVQAAEALLSTSPRGKDMKVDGEAFFLTDGKPIPFWTMTHTLWALSGDKYWAQPEEKKVIVIPFWVVLAFVGLTEWLFRIFTLGTVQPGKVKQHFLYLEEGCWFDISKARKRLGYEPLVDTEQGLKRTVKWFRENEGWEKKEERRL